VESITINQSTAGAWFKVLMSPRLEMSKKAAYQTKELMKTGYLAALYFRARNLYGTNRLSLSRRGPTKPTPPHIGD
jgi:hypothetical protein